MFHVEREAFQQKTGVSYETLTKLDRYAELLAEWNQKFNLVAEKSLPEIWTRHFLDCAQLWPLIPPTAKTIADMGSGAGFPGFVLAIMASESRADLQPLIESTGKKANFLRAVADESKINAVIRQCRAEVIRDLKADVVTARALSPLPELLKLSNTLINNTSVCIFLKGKSYIDELTESQRYWTFACEKIPSVSHDSGTVLVIKGLKWKNAAAHKFRRSRK